MSTPTLARETLGQLLEEARNANKMTAEEVAARCGMDATVIRRWERGITKVTPPNAEYLANLYEVSPEEKALWTSLAFKAKEKNLFESTKVPPSLRVLVAAEARARKLQTLELENIPGLLQTPAYHQAIQNVGLPVDPDTAAEFRALRVQRQEAIFGDGAARRRRRMDFIIGLAAMAYLKAWPDVEAEQIERLRQVNAMPNASVRIITGAHAAMSGSFAIITPPPSSKAKPLAYVDSADGIRYVDDADVVSDYERMFHTVRDDQSNTIEEYLT